MKKTKKSVNYPALDKLVKFEAAVTAKQSEVITKHNELVTNISAIEELIKTLAGSMATEVGKLNGTVEGHMQVLSGLDFNILATAEVLRNISCQISILNKRISKSIPELTPDELKEAEMEGEGWFKRMVSDGFDAVRTRLETEARQRRDDMQKAQEELAKKAEAQTVEQELKKAETEVERKVTSDLTGGPGSDYPAEAEIWGGSNA